MPPRAPKSENEPTERMRFLLVAVREGGDPYWIPRRVAALSDAERRACVPLLDELHKSWAGRSPLRGQRKALRIAGLGCRTGAAAATAWLVARDLGWSWGDEEIPLILDVLADRDAAWLGDVAHRLAERPSAAEERFALIAALTLRSGCPVPATDGFVRRWATHLSLSRRPHGDSTLLDRLRDDPFLTAVVPRLFEVEDVGARLVLPHHDGPHSWPYSLTRLAAEGRLDRQDLIDRCLSRLLRGDRPVHMRGFFHILRALDPTPDEQASRTADWVRMLPDTHSTFARYAQQVIANLDTAGRLTTGQLAEASRAVLFRPEKGLVRAQLTLLDKALKRAPSHAGELLPVAADAFGHDDHGIQETALKLVTRHLAHTDDAVRAELAAAAEQLAPGLRRVAAEALGQAAVEEPHHPAPADVLPPAPSPVLLSPPARSATELAENVGALLCGGDPTDFERVLDGLVRHAHQDITALALALEPVARRHPSWLGADGHVNPLTLGIDVVVAAVRRSVSRGAVGDARDRAESRPHFDAIVVTRVLETAHRILTFEPTPLLLATPTWSSGIIDPAELVARLRAYEEAGAEPGRADLHQALLRLDRQHVDPAVLNAAAGLTSPAGRRLAAWLAAGGLPDPVVVPVAEQEPPTPVGRWDTPRPTRRVLLSVEAVGGCEDFPEPFRSLFRPFGPDDPWWASSDPRHALAVVPGHRELVAARLLWQPAMAADLDARGDTRLLPALAEADGPAGPAVHLTLAYGLGARRPEDRLSAVDALLILAARDQLDAEQLGRHIAALVDMGALKAQRLADSFRQAARAGALATTWAVLSDALPILLTGPLTGVQVRGLAEVLAVAADCAEHTGVRGPIAEVTVLAKRPGSSQLARQTRRLRDTLAGGK